MFLKIWDIEGIGVARLGNRPETWSFPSCCYIRITMYIVGFLPTSPLGSRSRKKREHTCKKYVLSRENMYCKKASFCMFTNLSRKSIYHRYRFQLKWKSCKCRSHHCQLTSTALFRVSQCLSTVLLICPMLCI